MIQQKTPGKKKTVFSITLILVMVVGTFVLLFGKGSSRSSTLPSVIGGNPLSGITPQGSIGVPAVRFEKSVFDNKEFLTLIQQSSLPEITQSQKGRPNPFAPLIDLEQ